MISKRYLSRDWVGVWYKLLKERGENDIVVMGRGLIDESGQVSRSEYFNFSHSQMDGTSVMPFILNKLGAQLSPRVSTYKKKLSFFKVFRLTMKVLFNKDELSPSGHPDWKEADIARQGELESFAVHAFTKKETEQLQKFCKASKISENAILLKCLTQEAMKLVNNPHDYLRWLFPVNVRGIVNKRDAYENHSSYVPIDVNVETTEKDIHALMLKKLKSLTYIGIWWIHHIGVLFGINYMRKLSLQSSLKNFWLGTFSNMGIWNIDSTDYQSLGENETWFFSTPGSYNFPISLVAITYNGRLTLSLRVSPKVACKSELTSKEMLNSMKAFISKNYLQA